MGRLRKIRLHNFKSYDGQRDIPIGEAYFTSIVGPNGSGKSNLMDAISFALGLNLELIRVSEPQSLVSEGARNGTAFVELEYERQNGTVVKFKGSIRNNQCFYAIDGKEMDHQTYKDELAKESILVDAKNFLVFQNDVERVANGNREEICTLIERISGSVNCRPEYERTKKKLERAKRAATAAFAARKELKAEIQQYTQQERTKAEFDGLKEELKQKRVELVEKRILLHDLRSLETEQNRKEIEAGLQAAKQAVENAQKTYDQASREYAIARREAVRGEALSREHQDKISSLATDQDSLKRKIELANNDSEAWKNKIEYSSKQLEQAGAELKQAEKDLRIVERAEQDLEEKFASLESISSLTQEQQEEFLQLKSQYLLQTNDARQEEGRIERQLTLKENDESILTDNLATAQLRVDKLKEEHELVEIEKNQLETFIKERKEVLVSKRKELEQIGVDLQKSRSKIENQKMALSKASSDLRQSDGSIEHAKIRNNFLDAVARLKRKFPGVVDTMSNLVEPKEKRFNRAVDRVLGAHFDSVVVNNFDTASKCIEYLNKEELGHMTFLPIDDLKVNIVDRMLRTIHPKARLAIDAVQYSDKARIAVAFVCGNTLICDDLDIALSLRKQKNVKSRLVTIEGSLVHSNGAITGGIVKETTRYDERQLVTLQRKIETLVESINSETSHAADLQFQEEATATDYDKLSKLVKFKETSLDTALKRLESLQREIEHLVRESIDPKKEELQEVQQVISDLRSQLDAVKARLLDAKSNVYGAFCSKTGVDIDNYERNFGVETRQRRELAKQRMRLEDVYRLAKAHYEASEARVNDHKKRYTEFREFLASLNERLADVQRERNEALEQYEELKQSIDEATAKAEKLSEDLVALEAQKDELNEAFQDETSKYEEYEETQNLLEEKRKAILRDAQFDGIEVSADLRKQAKEPQESVLELEAAMVTLDSESREIKNRLESMVINTNALEYLERAKEQLEIASDDLVAKRKASEVASKEFDQIKEQRRSTFCEAFDHIKSNINDVYQELTRSRHQPMGGTANLVIINEDEPYLEGVEYTIMPPSKRFCELSQLSGGERTVAALALLFAIHSFQPAPFFVLDEVDSALDYVNVALLGQYLERHAGPDFQFIVISFKLQLYSQANSLIGIYKDPNEYRSQVLSYRMDDDAVMGNE